MNNGIRRLVDDIEARSFNCAGLYLDQRESLILLILLPIFQALDRIPVGRLPTLEKNRQEGDQQAEEAGGQEDPWTEGDAVVVVFQPIAHEIPGDGHCQHKGDPNVDEERAYQLRQDLLAV